MWIGLFELNMQSRLQSPSDESLENPTSRSEWPPALRTCGVDIEFTSASTRINRIEIRFASHGIKFLPRPLKSAVEP